MRAAGSEAGVILGGGEGVRGRAVAVVVKGGVGQCSFVPVVTSVPPLTPGVFHKECVITAFVGFPSCNGSSGRPC